MSSLPSKRVASRESSSGCRPYLRTHHTSGFHPSRQLFFPFPPSLPSPPPLVRNPSYSHGRHPAVRLNASRRSNPRKRGPRFFVGKRERERTQRGWIIKEEDLQPSYEIHAHFAPSNVVHEWHQRAHRPLLFSVESVFLSVLHAGKDEGAMMTRARDILRRNRNRTALLCQNREGERGEDPQSLSKRSMQDETRDGTYTRYMCVIVVIVLSFYTVLLQCNFIAAHKAETRVQCTCTIVRYQLS